MSVSTYPYIHTHTNPYLYLSTTVENRDCIVTRKAR